MSSIGWAVADCPPMKRENPTGPKNNRQPNDSFHCQEFLLSFSGQISVIDVSRAFQSLEGLRPIIRSPRFSPPLVPAVEGLFLHEADSSTIKPSGIWSALSLSRRNSTKMVLCVSRCSLMTNSASAGLRAFNASMIFRCPTALPRIGPESREKALKYGRRVAGSSFA